MNEEQLQHWLLNFVVDGMYPLAMFRQEYSEHVISDPPELPYERLVTVLHHLFQRGDIIAQRMNRFPTPPGSCFVPTLAEIEESIEGTDFLHYGLTAQGGTRWEQLVQPPWAHYICDSYYPTESAGDVSGGDQHHVAAFFAVVPYLREVISESVIWEVVTPWQATYWKTLPVSYRVRYHCVPQDEDAPHREIPDWVWQRVTALRHWYIKHPDA